MEGRRSEGKWRGHYRIRPRRIVAAGEFGETAVHRHPIVQVTIAYSGELIATDGRSEVRCRAVIIPSSTRHTLRRVGSDVRVLSIHMPTVTADARAVGSLVCGFGPEAWVAAAQPLQEISLSEEEDLDTAADRVISVLRAKASQEMLVAPRALSVAGEAIGHLVPTGRVRLADLAAASSTSRRRLSALFTGETGSGFAASVRWARLIYAFRELEAGKSITEAAHAAGFTDSAHATRVCREMSGVTPTTVVDALRYANKSRDRSAPTTNGSSNPGAAANAKSTAESLDTSGV